MPNKLAFVTAVEHGHLEDQAALLFESIRRFGGQFGTAPIWAVQPRLGEPIRRKTLKAFHNLDVVLVSANLNRRWPEYGFVNKVCAAAFVEPIAARVAETLVLMDADMLVLNQPDELVLINDESVAVCPVDRLHGGSVASEPVNSYWELVYGVCGVAATSVWNVTATIDQILIRAYFQGGLVAARPSTQLFARWKRNLETFRDYLGDPRVVSTHRGAVYLEPASLAGTILATLPREAVRLLDAQYDYPLHRHGELAEAVRAADLGKVVIAHYHHLFYDRNWMRAIPVPARYRDWLEDRTPLRRTFRMLLKDNGLRRAFRRLVRDARRAS